MEYKLISYCFEGRSDEEDINIRGWVHRLRKQKDNIFLILRGSLEMNPVSKNNEKILSIIKC